jgi:hypothetical protein
MFEAHDAKLTFLSVLLGYALTVAAGSKSIAA